MTSIVDFIFLILAAFLGKREGLLAVNFTPPPPDFSTKCKIALLLSAFAFAPSVLAAYIPVVTLSAENIQVRAEWNVVPRDNPDFRMDGNTLVFQSNIDGAGKPNGATIIATVEVLDKFSTLNPLYADLTTRVKVTTVIMGCHPAWGRGFAKSYDFSGWIAVDFVHSNFIEVGDVLYRVTGGAGYKQPLLNTVTARHSTVRSNRRGRKFFIQTSPTLPVTKWDIVNLPSGYHYNIYVNKAENCFDEAIEALQEENQIELEKQAKNQYLNANAPKVNTGVYAGGVYADDENVKNARVISVGTAFVIGDEQIFYLYNVTLANLLMELYPITVINDDGKAFSIYKDYQIGNRYEYVAKFVGSDFVHGGKYGQPHEVIIVNSCPATTPVSVIARIYSGSLRIDSRPGEPTLAELATYKYVLIGGVVYKFNNGLTAASDNGGGTIVSAPGFDASSLTASEWPGTIKFSADHFLCESI
ncbi:MAG: hypothetical protein ACR2PV_03095 [Gammaproteobacteria bacterium]